MYIIKNTQYNNAIPNAASAVYANINGLIKHDPTTNNIVYIIIFAVFITDILLSNISNNSLILNTYY